MSQRQLVLAIGALLAAPAPAFALNLTETAVANDTRATAQNLDGSFSSESVANIFSSTVVPHASISGSNGAQADVDYYRFTVATAGTQAFFDIDGAEGPGGCAQQPPQLHTALALFDANGNLLGFDVASTVDAGSTAAACSQGLVADTFLGTFTFTAPGTYYIAVTNSPWFDESIGGNVATPGTLVAPLVRPDGMNGGDRYAGDSGPTTLTADGFYASGVYTLHVSLQQGQAPTLGAVPIPLPALGVLALGLLGLGARRLSRKRE